MEIDAYFLMVVTEKKGSSPSKWWFFFCVCVRCFACFVLCAFMYVCKYDYHITVSIKTLAVCVEAF